MALVEYTNGEGKEISYYMDDWLKKQIDKNIKNILSKEDEDYVLIIDGKERTGKSTFAQQVGGYIDHNMTVDKICFDPDEFKNRIINAKRGEVIIFDEAYRGFSSKGTLTEINKILVSLMMECGQKNLMIIVVLPTFYMLERYVAIWRARGLFHVYRKNGKKGYWRFYNKSKNYMYNDKNLKNKLIYIKKGRRGRFFSKYVVDKDIYLKKKNKSLHSSLFQASTHKWFDQRNKFINLLYTEYSMTHRDMAELLSKYDIELKRSQIQQILSNFKQKELNDLIHPLEPTF